MDFELRTELDESDLKGDRQGAKGELEVEWARGHVQAHGIQPDSVKHVDKGGGGNSMLPK